MSVVLDKRPFNKIKENMLKLNNSSTQAGFFGGKPHDAKGNTEATVALWQEYGTSTGRGNISIPERPFMSSTYIIHKGYKREVSILVKNLMLGRSTTETELHSLGKTIATNMQEILWNWSYPANTEATKKRKGFNNPLVEHGALFRNVDHRTVMKGGRR